MLCQFSFQNFKSYKGETVIDFQAASIPEFSESILSCKAQTKDGKEVKGPFLLPVGVVYGPNGGGKSNLLSALSCLISKVVKPIIDLEKTRERMIITQPNVGYEPFLLDEVSREHPTEFEIFFCCEKNVYRYYLALFNEEIVSESLYWRTVGGKRTGTVFEREHSDIMLGSSISKASVSRSVNPKMPYLSFLAINYDIPMIAEVQSWFESCIIRSYAYPDVDQRIILSQNDLIKKDVIKALNDMGIDISDYRFDEEKQIYTQRIVNGKTYELKYTDESDGTKKLITAMHVFLLALWKGRLVIIDELDAKLHPKLLRYIISMFKNPRLNTKGAQLLFTSHDVTTMKNTVFRRDEIWFAAENESHESEIYSLYEIRREDNERIKNTAAYDKQYLEGRYGADPYLTNMLTGGDWT